MFYTDKMSEKDGERLRLEGIRETREWLMLNPRIIASEIYAEGPMPPHCDARVLHAPGECPFCDAHPEWQRARMLWGISFTGKPEEGKLLCPSDVARSVGGAHVWGGNRPTEVTKDPK